MNDSIEVKKEISNNIEPLVEVMVDKTQINIKPPKDIASEVAGKIQNRLKDPKSIEKVSISTLFNYIAKSYPLRPGVLIDGAKGNDFKLQELIFIDVDNKEENKDNITTLEETLSILKKHTLKPIGYYYTLSHTEELPRFRIILRLDKPIYDITKMNTLLKGICNLIPNVDTSCATVAKFFYSASGADKVFILDKNAVIPLEQVEDLLMKVATMDAKKKSFYKDELNQQIKDFDFYGYLCNETQVLRKGSNYVAFDVCPICGHNDCLRYYPDTNSFYCFGSSGSTGGSIIEYIIATKKMDRKEAINHFRYEILKLPREKEKQIGNLSIDEMKVRDREIIEKQIKKLKVEIKLPEDIDWVIYKEIKDGILTKISCPRLAKFIQENTHYLFIDTVVDEKVPKYFYENGVYKLYSDKKVQKIIKSLIPLDSADTKVIFDVFDFLCIDSNYIEMDKLNSDEDIVNFKDYIVRLSTGKKEPHNPKYLSTIQYDCNYLNNPIPPKTGYFDRYLDDLTGGDKGQQQLILEIIGVGLSNLDGSKLKHALILFGSGDTGKSRLPIVLEDTIGKENVTSADLKSMDKNFTRINLLNKRFAFFNDVSSLKINSLDIFKKITGGDSLNDSWKHRDSINFRFKGVMILVMNEFLKFGGDSGDHVWGRFLPIETTNVIPFEKRDKELVKHMLEEKDYIISKALQAARKVIENGYNYTIPESVLKTREKYRNEHDTIKRFILECTERTIREPEPNDPTTGQFYSIYQNWVKANNLYDEGHSKFRETILEETKEEKPKKTYGGNTFYKGIIPTDEVRVTFGEEKGVFKKQI